MSYEYATERPFVFTEEGQVMFLAIRDKAQHLCELAGAVNVEKLMCVSGCSWSMLACVDRLIELGEFKYVNDGENVATQWKVLRRLK